MDDDLEKELIRNIAILLIIRILQITISICALFGIAIQRYPESILAILFCLVINSGIPRDK